jgi:hypothetical protein
MAFITAIQAQIISELRATVMDRLHMGGSFLQQAPTVTIGGLKVATKQGGLGALGSSLGGALGALGGLSGLAGLATQISSLSSLANLAQIGDLKALAGNLTGLGDSLGGLGDITKNLGDLTKMTSLLSDVIPLIDDVSKLGDFQNMISDLGGLDALKNQISDISSFSDKLGSLNGLTSSVSSIANGNLTGASEFLQNPVASKISEISTLKSVTDTKFSSVFSRINSVAASTGNPNIGYDIDNKFTDLTTNLSKLQNHTDTLSGLKEKTAFITPEVGDPTYYNDLNDIIRMGSQMQNALGVDTNTVIATAASALQSESTYDSITNDMNVNVNLALDTIESLTPDGGANDIIIMECANKIYSSLNNHTDTIYNIIDSDIQTAQTYEEKVNAIDKITKSSSMVNTDGFSKLQNMLVRQDKMDLITYK